MLSRIIVVQMDLFDFLQFLFGLMISNTEIGLTPFFLTVIVKKQNKAL